MIEIRTSSKFKQQATIILCQQEQVKKRNFTHINNPAIQKILSQLVVNGQFFGELHEKFPVAINDQTILFVGTGTKEETSLTSLRIAVKDALLSSFIKTVSDVEIVPQEHHEQSIIAILEGILIGTYSWKKYRSVESKTNEVSIEKKNVYVITSKKQIYDDVMTICQGVTLARDLINDNADTVTSEFFEKTIKTLIKGKKNISLEILNEDEMKDKGLKLHLAVNQGSSKEPKLIIVQYTGSVKKDDFTALVGKGMTFDTGGLNLKPTGSMETMRCDMSGAAAVVGTLKNVIDLNLKKNILFACTVAENAISANAFKPGDVIQSYSGKTVEIGNTDAEGRLVLADAISYIVKNYKPKRLIDIATLTGACVIALGYDFSGLISTDDKMAEALIHSANVTDDRVWRLPTYPELKNYVKSPIADIRNLGLPKGAAGTLTGAEFIRQFTENTPWAHLDIAGTAFTDGKGRLYYEHGGTGAGVRLLTHYLQHN